MVEEWKVISVYPDFRISNTGKVKNMRTGKLLKPFYDEGHKDIVVKLERGKKYSLGYLVWVHFKGAVPRYHRVAKVDSSLPWYVTNLKLVATKRRTRADERIPGMAKLICTLYKKFDVTPTDLATILNVKVSDIYYRLKEGKVPVRETKEKSYV